MTAATAVIGAYAALADDDAAAAVVGEKAPLLPVVGDTNVVEVVNETHEPPRTLRDRYSCCCCCCC